RMSAKKAVCASNLKQMYVAEASYTSNNSGWITPASLKSAGKWISYDDLLSDYMGRQMTETQKNALNLYSDNEDSMAIGHDVLACPNDDTPRGEGRIARSYAGIGKHHDQDASSNSEAYGPMRNNWSIHASKITDAGGTLAFTERHDSNGLIGNVIRAGLHRAGLLQDGMEAEWAAPHGKYLKYNFVFWDGHVLETHVKNTSSSFGMPSGGAWSIDPSD
ncbi:MAG: hypothetical protein NE330_16035, partial [Lentisphaeraceae bacterium]|nr:hypothetical protein [Lentisphaeraceae bacterium]